MVSDKHEDCSQLSSILKKATARKGKPLTEKEISKFKMLNQELKKCEQELETLQMQHLKNSSNENQDSMSSRPKPEDFGLPSNEIHPTEEAISKGMRINRFLSWLLYVFALITGILVWKATNEVLYAIPFSCFLFLMGLNSSDSKRLVKLWKYRKRSQIDAYYRFEIAWWHYFRQLEKSSIDFWKTLSGRDFEIEIANLFRTHEYTVNITGGSGDGGVDLTISKGGKYTIVQCKRWKNPATPAVVRELYGALTASGAHDAILVCTGGFTSGVYDFVRNKPIQLMDLNNILALQNLTVETYGFYTKK